MAKLTGILRIKGTLQDMTFYKSQDGNLVRTKGGVSGERIANDPTFIRTRENGVEFGSAAIAGKLLRDTVRVLMQNASDNRVTSRITQLMTQIKNFDDTRARGERVVSIGINTKGGANVLRGFNFNGRSILGSVLFQAYTVDTATGVISLANLVPVNDVKAVPGATHMTLRGAYAVVDFESGENEIQYTNVENLPIDGVSTSITLTPAAPPTVVGTKMFLLEIAYFQEVNGVQYTLNNGAFNALEIVDVDNPATIE